MATLHAEVQYYLTAFPNTPTKPAGSAFVVAGLLNAHLLYSNTQQ